MPVPLLQTLHGFSGEVNVDIARPSGCRYGRVLDSWLAFRYSYFGRRYFKLVLRVPLTMFLIQPFLETFRHVTCQIAPGFALK